MKQHLTQDERRLLRCYCTRLGDVWHHERHCPAPAVEEVLQARHEAMVDEVFKRAQQAYGNWTLGHMASTIASTLLGVAHDFDHPDCEDSTIIHLGQWQRSRLDHLWPCDNYRPPTNCIETETTTPCDQCRIRAKKDTP